MYNIIFSGSETPIVHGEVGMDFGCGLGIKNTK